MVDEPEVFLFPDTNVFLHYEMFDEVDWSALVGGRPVVLCISRTVTKELEEKKYDQKLSNRKRKRVQNVSAKLDRYLHDSGRVRPDVRLLVVKHPDASRVPDDLNLDHADDAHVAAAYEHKSRNASDARIVTADFNLRNSARAVGVGLLTLPTPLELPPEPDDAEVELRRLRLENEKLKSLPRPKLTLGFPGGTSVMRLKRPATPLPELLPATLVEAGVSELDELTFALLAVPKELRIAQATYRRAKADFENDIALTVSLKLTLFNSGEAPARGVHVELKFPERTLLRDELPEAPKEPKWPAAMFEYPNPYAGIAPIYDPTDWRIADHVAETSRKEIVQSLHRDLDSLYVRPPGGEKGFENFQIQCRVVTSDPPMQDEFRLHIVYDDGQ